MNSAWQDVRVVREQFVKGCVRWPWPYCRTHHRRWMTLAVALSSNCTGTKYLIYNFMFSRHSIFAAWMLSKVCRRRCGPKDWYLLILFRGMKQQLLNKIHVLFVPSCCETNSLCGHFCHCVLCSQSYKTTMYMFCNSLILFSNCYSTIKKLVWILSSFIWINHTHGHKEAG